MTATSAHAAVMKKEVLAAIAPRAGGLYLDLTLGGAGHAEAILTADGEPRVLGIDRDETAIAAASARLAKYVENGRLRLVHASFAEMSELLPETFGEVREGGAGGRRFDGVLADLGVSSPQLDDPERGMSFRREASSSPLDMRMDRSSGVTARHLIEHATEEELADAIFTYGEERRSRKIARSIKQAFAQRAMETTGDLRHAIYAAIGGTKKHGLDPATRTFQAIRIAVNDEIGELDRMLAALPALLADGGVAAVISFHSLEDRRVKQAFANPPWVVLTRGPSTPSDAEVARNPRARSAKLRTARVDRGSAEDSEEEKKARRYAERRARRHRAGDVGKRGAS